MTMTGQHGDGVSRAAILAALAGNPQLSRIELAKRLGFGASTISTQVRRLVDSGYLRELPPHSTGSGRPRIPLQCVPEAGFVIGVELTPQRMIVTAVGIDGRIVGEGRAAFDPSSEVIPQLADQILAFAGGIEGRGACIAVGIALSGVVDRGASGVIVSVVMQWRGVSLAEELSQRVGLPVYVENDVYSIAARELMFGDQVQKDDFVLVELGLGVGMAVVSERAVFRGGGHSSTEFGHVSIDPVGRPCSCGNVGCLQAYAGLREILRDVERATGTQGLTLETLTGLAARADQAVTGVLEGIGALLGRAVGAAVTLLGISHVVVTGASTLLWPYLSGGFARAVRENTPTLLQRVELQVRPWDELAGSAGAASLALARALDRIQ